MGANKFDLLEQYLGFASNGDGSPAATKVTRAMGRKAIVDAREAGFRFLRISASGFFPFMPNGPQKDVLLLWQADPAAFWRGADAMLDDLDAAGLRVVPTLMWNEQQFPAMTGETTADLVTNPKSRSRALAVRFMTEFATRYRGRNTVLFYELSNELNLKADLDLRKRCRDDNASHATWCGSVGNFSTAAMEGFAHDMAAAIHAADPASRLSSGYSLPREDAMHLARKPEWSVGGPDWTPDPPAEFGRTQTDTQQDFDVVSIHVYPGRDSFGTPSVDLIRRAAIAVHAAGKKLFVGEFGDHGASAFMREVVRDVDDGAADYAALWIWEFYQTSTFATRDSGPSSFSIEPGIDDGFLSLLHHADKTKPQIVLTWPLPCAAINAPVSLSAVASDGVAAPARVTFTLDGKPVGDASGPPYRLLFDPHGRPAELAVIEARMEARDGTAASDRATVRLNGSTSACAP